MQTPKTARTDHKAAETDVIKGKAKSHLSEILPLMDSIPADDIPDELEKIDEELEKARAKCQELDPKKKRK